MEEQAFLITAANDNEAGVIESLMNGYGILVRRKYRGAGGYLRLYMGMTVMGIDLFVPANQLEKARELLNALPQPDFESDNGEQAEYGDPDPEMAAAGRRHALYRRLLAWILLIAIPGLLWTAVARAINIIRHLIQ